MDVRFSPQPWTRPTTPTEKRRKSPFSTSYTKTLEKLEYELNKLGATEILIECSFSSEQIRLDGWPKLNQRPRYNGVVVSFNQPGVGRVEYPCDSCMDYQDNLHSIALGLEALRAVERYGITGQKQQYTGFKAIGAGNGDGRRGAATWIAKLLFEVAESQKNTRDALLDPQESADSVRRIVNAARKKAHPDTGGSDEMYKLLTEKLETLGFK
jgi:hypothetical protein